MELLNKELAPVKVHGFRQYHSDFKPDDKNFKIEPDLSGGSNMVELVTGPMHYNDAKFYLIKILKFIQNYGYTNDKSSIHFNLSFFGEKNLNDLNVLKLILNTDEDEIYRFYPSRKGNIYAKSVKKVIPYKEYDFFNISIACCNFFGQLLLKFFNKSLLCLILWSKSTKYCAVNARSFHVHN